MGYIYINIILCDITILTQSNAHGLHVHEQYLMSRYHTNRINTLAKSYVPSSSYFWNSWCLSFPSKRKEVDVFR